MDREPYIESRQNEQVKNLVKLKERKHRERQSRFVVEGLRELEHAIGSGYGIEVIYYCPECFPQEAHVRFIDEQRRAGTIPLVRMHADAFAKAANREGPDGLLGLARHQGQDLSSLRLPPAPLLLVLEGIEKPGNLGAILRSADGAGAHAVILVDCVLDLFNPNAIRSSQGLVFALPVITTSRESLTRWLDEKAITLVATTPDTDTLHWAVDYRPATALFLGSESSGLSDYWLERAAQRIRIPMAGRADSLNVAAATAVCLYEAARQRQS